MVEFHPEPMLVMMCFVAGEYNPFKNVTFVCKDPLPEYVEKVN